MNKNDIYLAIYNYRLHQNCCDVAFQYAHERKQFGTQIANFQLIQVSINNFDTFYLTKHDTNLNRNFQDSLTLRINKNFVNNWKNQIF